MILYLCRESCLWNTVHPSYLDVDSYCSSHLLSVGTSAGADDVFDQNQNVKTRRSISVDRAGSS